MLTFEQIVQAQIMGKIKNLPELLIMLLNDSDAALESEFINPLFKDKHDDLKTRQHIVLHLMSLSEKYEQDDLYRKKAEALYNAFPPCKQVVEKTFLTPEYFKKYCLLLREATFNTEHLANLALEVFIAKDNPDQLEALILASRQNILAPLVIKPSVSAIRCAEVGAIRCLNFFYEKLTTFDLPTENCLIKTAAANNQLEMLRHLCEKQPLVINQNRNEALRMAIAHHAHEAVDYLLTLPVVSTRLYIQNHLPLKSAIEHHNLHAVTEITKFKDVKLALKQEKKVQKNVATWLSSARRSFRYSHADHRFADQEAIEKHINSIVEVSLSTPIYAPTWVYYNNSPTPTPQPQPRATNSVLRKKRK